VSSVGQRMPLYIVHLITDKLTVRVWRDCAGWFRKTMA